MNCWYFKEWAFFIWH